MPRRIRDCPAGLVLAAVLGNIIGATVVVLAFGP